MRLPWAPEFRGSHILQLGNKLLYSGYNRIREYALKIPLFEGGHSLITREILDRPQAVTVLLYDDSKRTVTLVEQFRTGAIESDQNPWLLEIVAGLIDKGESIIDAAIREVREETGCQVLSFLPICSYYPSPGSSNEKIHIYCAKVVSPNGSSIHGIAHEGENIKTHIFTLEEAFQLLNEGIIVSSPTIIALQWLQLNVTTLHFPQ